MSPLCPAAVRSLVAWGDVFRPCRNQLEGVDGLATRDEDIYRDELQRDEHRVMRLDGFLMNWVLSMRFGDDMRNFDDIFRC